MSTGFDTDEAAGRNERSSATVAALSSGTSRPCDSHVSAHRIPKPPAFVTMATRLPAGTGWSARSVATSNSCSSVSVRITPLWRKSASTVESEAASSAPVCDIAARLPAVLRPLFTATIGLRLPMRRASLANRRGFPKDSRYISTTSVSGSSSQ